MGQLWFNTLGILHDGVGLVLCNYCPCEPPPSESESSSVSESESVSESVSDSCTSSTCVEVDCCPGVQIPTVLTMVFSGGSCDGTYTLVWFVDPISGEGEWGSNDGPPNTNVRLQCNNGTWELVVSLDTLSPDSVSCNPFELVFSVFGNPFCGDFTITITG